MASYIILSLFIGRVRLCLFQLPGEHPALQPFLVTCRTAIDISVPPDTHLH